MTTDAEIRALAQAVGRMLDRQEANAREAEQRRLARRAARAAKKLRESES